MPNLSYILGVLWFVLFLIAAFEILTGGKPLGAKVIWLLVIFFLPFIGVILYYLIGRGK